MGRPKGSKNNTKTDNLSKINRTKKEVEKNLKNGNAPKVHNIIGETNPESPPQGNPTGVCKRCGKVFEQRVARGQNKYTNFKHCPSCIREIEKEKKKLLQLEKEPETAYIADLPYTPFPKQAEMHEAFEKCRFQVLSCGNRFGKDRYTIMAGIKYFVECLSENRIKHNPDLVPAVYWWMIAPTERMALQNWRELQKYFPKDWIVAVSNSTMTMETINGGMIEVRSAYDPESLVGVGLDLVTITEAARIKDLKTVWANIEARLNSAGRGRAIDRNGRKFGLGKAIINSSPIGKNEFYNMWTWGQKTHDNYTSDWISFQCPWTDNPVNEAKANEIIQTKYGPMTYAEDLRRRIGERAYRQNYLADFLSGDTSVFPTFKETCLYDLYSTKYGFSEANRKKEIEKWKEVNPYHRYRLGWDIATGSSGDSPTLVVRDLEENKIVMALDMYGNNYEQQYDIIAYWSAKYNHAPCVFSQTGHTPCVGQLAVRGVQEIVVNEQGSNKATFVQNLAYAVQSRDVTVIVDGSVDTQKLIDQMDDYSERNGKYSNNKEEHDDFVSALYLAYYDYSLDVDKIPFVGMMDCV